MYNKIFTIIFLLLPFYSAQSIEYTEGDYYVEVEGDVTTKKEITEYFSFYCPACYKQEPFMNELKAMLPADATFKKNHVDGMPGREPTIELGLTKALITAKLLKVEEQITAAIFNYIHVNKANFDNEKDIKNLFLLQGIDSKKLDKTFASFSVNMQAKKMQKNTADLRRQGHTSVPTLIVNGKYKPVTKNIKSLDEYKQLILFLLNKTT